MRFENTFLQDNLTYVLDTPKYELFLNWYNGMISAKYGADKSDKDKAMLRKKGICPKCKKVKSQDEIPPEKWLSGTCEICGGKGRKGFFRKKCKTCDGSGKRKNVDPFKLLRRHAIQESDPRFLYTL